MAPRRPFVTDATLTAIAVAYRNPAQALIADQVLPRVPTDEEFKWMFYPLEEGFNAPDARVGRRGRPNMIEASGEERTSSTEDYGYDASIPNSDIARAEQLRARGMTGYDPRARAAMQLADLMLLQREVRVAGIVQDTANYAATRRVTLSGTSQFSDYAASDPISVIKAALEGTLVYKPNKLVMGQPVWSKLRAHPDIVNAVKGTESGKGMVTRQELADLFEVQEILVGESYVNLAKPGQTANLGRVWGKHIAALYINPTAGAEQITWGFTAQYGSKIAGSFEDRDIGLDGGERLRVGEKVREVVVAPDTGYLIQNAVA